MNDPHLVHNEQTKLTANWFNMVSSGTAVVSILMLAIGVFESSSRQLERSGFFLVCGALSVILHLLGRAVLRRLRS